LLPAYVYNTLAVTGGVFRGPSMAVESVFVSLVNFWSTYRMLVHVQKWPPSGNIGNYQCWFLRAGCLCWW